ncbi:MAG: hypothetical protein NDI82_07890 [Anaeromyxobacteraceae bacterium]|nr:hypothetical protein [Anaeromyxobacteraceae bacterium]
MRTALLAVAALAALAAAPSPAAAQVNIHAGIRFGLPALPTLVVVQPGIQVVEGFDDEVFVHQGAYYARRDGRWYRGAGPQASFVVVETRVVPEPLRRIPPGHYRRYRAPAPPPVRRVVVEERRRDKKEEKRERKEREKERKAHEREHEHEHGHDRHR